MDKPEVPRCQTSLQGWLVGCVAVLVDFKSELTGSENKKLNFKLAKPIPTAAMIKPKHVLSYLKITLNTESTFKSIQH